MSKHKPEYERKYPDHTYPKDAYDRLYGNRDAIKSNDVVENSDLSPEETADYLFKNGYVDPETISRKAVIEKIRELRKEKADD